MREPESGPGPPREQLERLRLKGIPGTSARREAAAIFLGFWAATTSQAAQPDSGPLPPNEEAATFRFADPALAIELVAAEPDIVSPVAIAWDAAGRMYVAEMRDYPAESSGGQITRLEDSDGDGRYERSVVFAGDLPFPNSVLPWGDGVLVTAAPNLWFLRDNDRDGVAEERRVLFSGFGEGNQQLRANGLFWGLDNWVYGANGRSDGQVRWMGNAGGSALSSPTGRAVSIQRRDFRFRPDTGAFEALAGQSQFGAARDDWGNRFLSWNTIPVRHEVLPGRYLERQPALGSERGIENLAPADDDGRVFPVSAPPLVFNQESSSHYNAMAGLAIFRGEALGREYYGNALVGETLRNLAHRRVLIPRGPTFSALRGERQVEFLASTDPWFHPVNFATGPDGALYVVDFYRRFVEHPGYAPEGMRGKVNWRAGANHGRLWRVRRKDAVPGPLASRLDRAGTIGLIEALSHTNGWWRDTAQRLLIERRDRSASQPLKRILNRRGRTSALARLHALYTLEELGSLAAADLFAALEDPEAMLRVHALRLSEPRLSPGTNAVPDRLSKSDRARLEKAVLAMTRDPDARVAFQVALTLGELAPDRARPALARLADSRLGEGWMGLAILSSAGQRPWLLLHAILDKRPVWLDNDGQAAAEFLDRFGFLVGATPIDEDRLAALKWALEQLKEVPARFYLLAGLGEGWALQTPGGVYAERALALDPDLFRRAARAATNAAEKLALRSAAVRVLGFGGPAQSAAALQTLILPEHPTELQTAAARRLAGFEDSSLFAEVLSGWDRYRREVRRQLLASSSRSPALAVLMLEGVEGGRIAPGEVDPAARDAFRRNSNSSVRGRAQALFPARNAADRSQLIARFESALTRTGDRQRGAGLFANLCSSCHAVQGKGFALGPDLMAIGNRAGELLLADILDPNRQVTPDYMGYTLLTTDGGELTGLLVSETAAAVTIRRANLPDETVPRSKIRELRADGKSFMPEGLEEGLSEQDMADLLGFVRGPAADLLP